MRSKTVLVADHDRDSRRVVCGGLESRGCSVLEAADEQAALSRLGSADTVVLGQRLADTTGIALLRQVRALREMIPVILLADRCDVALAVQAVKEGAFDCVGRPFVLEEFAGSVARALEIAALQRKLSLDSVPVAPAPVDRIIGRSAAIRNAKVLLGRIARSPASTVLITGESGTGKDLAARVVHDGSARASRPFLNITCSAIPEQLLESELFGHERGAFTGAESRKPGLIEQAQGGTVFLDEIGEMTPPVQAKLLRFLEEKRFRRVGGATDLSADVRIVAATNVDLRKAVRARRFREDLYYRLAVLTVYMPPLRERGDDLTLLVGHFIRHFNREFGKNIRELPAGSFDRLRLHTWPGNVRELRNAMERAVLLSDGSRLELDRLGVARYRRPRRLEFKLPAAGIDVRSLERSLVSQALEQAGGNQTRAAALLGMNRDQIRYRIEKFRLPRRRDGVAALLGEMEPT